MVLHRYNGVLAGTSSPNVEQEHNCCQATKTNILSFFTLCMPIAGGSARIGSYELLVPTGCRCDTCPSQ